jgi:hypothetical protein
MKKTSISPCTPLRDASRPIHIERDIHQSMRDRKAGSGGRKAAGEGTRAGDLRVSRGGVQSSPGLRTGGAKEPLEARRKTRGDGPVARSPYLGRRPQPTRGSRGPGFPGPAGRSGPRETAAWIGPGFSGRPGNSALGWFGAGRPEGGSLHGGRGSADFLREAGCRARKGSCGWRTGRCEAAWLTPRGGSAAEPSGIDRGPFGAAAGSRPGRWLSL